MSCYDCIPTKQMCFGRHWLPRLLHWLHEVPVKPLHWCQPLLPSEQHADCICCLHAARELFPGGISEGRDIVGEDWIMTDLSGAPSAAAGDLA